MCHSRNCNKRAWYSKRIAMTTREFPGKEYNATVYHQRCANCYMPSKPLLESTYADRVVYRLKKWSGVEMEEPPHSGAKKGKPHAVSLCEGCKAGHCTEMNVGQARKGCKTKK